MARPKRWKPISFEKGVQTIRLTSWKYFGDYINKELLNYSNYIFRGQGKSEWLLEPALDRVIKAPNSPRRLRHLEKFKFETRGRRGSNPSTLETEYDWWALGQHHGLKTPLLDWTESPFVALYFAVVSALELESKEMTVFAFYEEGASRVNSLITNLETVQEINAKKPTVRIVRPFSDENSRLVNQRGLFTRSPNNMDLEKWLKEFISESMAEYQYLIKLHIPNKDLRECLKSLNRMNINHSTLFPDLIGASEYCNMHLDIPRY